MTSELRPVITEMGEMCEVDEGLLEMNLPKREFLKGRDVEYYKTREVRNLFLILYNVYYNSSTPRVSNDEMELPFEHTCN